MSILHNTIVHRDIKIYCNTKKIFVISQKVAFCILEAFHSVTKQPIVSILSLPHNYMSINQFPVLSQFSYRMGGNIRGRKLLQIGENLRSSWTKLSQIARFCRAKGCYAPKFRRENFSKKAQNCEIRKSFLPRKFPTIPVGLP